jgi:hypothetical protein
LDHQISAFGLDQDLKEPIEVSTNLASDVILWCHGIPVLRVSTALIERESSYYGDMSFIETWVFSDLREHSSRQFFPKTRIDHGYAIRAHERFVRFLRRRFEGLAND